MAFSVPYESSPPSTPNRSRGAFSNASTTPAGVPPSASHSFTPQGPPPSTIFGSSQPSRRSNLNFSESALSQPDFNGADSIMDPSFASSNYPMPRTKNAGAGKPFTASQSLFGTTNGTRFGDSMDFGNRGGYDSQFSQGAEEYEDYEDYDEEDDGNMDVENTNNISEDRFGFFGSTYSNAAPMTTAPLGQRKSIYSNPANAKRAKLDERWANPPAPVSKPKLAPRKKNSTIPSIVRDLAARTQKAMVSEPSDMIIETEDQLCAMYDKVRQSEFKEVDLQAALSEASTELADIWYECADKENKNPQHAAGSIGPGENAPGIAKASFLASLLLQLHHPPLVDANLGSSRGSAVRATARSLVLSGPNAKTYEPVPKVLLDWLNDFHPPQAYDLEALQNTNPNPTASPNFWDVIQASVLRGFLFDVVALLRSADFNYARSALEDGLTQAGYRGAQLQNVQKTINKAIQILEASPIVQQDDWDIKGEEWTSYRKRVTNALAELEEFAEGQDQPPPPPPVQATRFQAINFGMGQNTGGGLGGYPSFSQSARMAESRVPWTIYQNLKALYGILLGDSSAIMAQSQDWVEATIGLTVWWDGEDDSEIVNQNDFSASTSSVKRARVSKSQSHVPRSVDANPEDAYLRRLDYTFSCVTNDEIQGEAAFRLNSLNSLEVGLASIFEGNVEGVLGLLQLWSLCIASAVAEIASVGGWLETAAGGKSLPGFLSENDLMVLSYGQDGNAATRRLQKDDILVAYAEGLFGRRQFENEDGVRDGWEVSLEILSRLDDADTMQKKVSEILDKIPLDTAEQMDKVVLLCTELGLDNEGRRVSERYGDRVASESEEYGLALVCYARAHSSRKVKSVLDLLTSYSLVQSRAYPAVADLDEQLRSLISEPKTCLSAIAAVDTEAARILQFYFSGYATLRRFYDIRDEEIGLEEGEKPKHKPLARKRAAADALVAVIRSASDSIYGGLYDPDRDTAVQVDGLLALLGEALVFVDRPTAFLTLSQQSTILSAIEDLETVTPRVFAQCEECFRSTLVHYHSYERSSTSGSDSSASFVLPPSPRTLLKKSVSNATASSGFSLIGNEMLESHSRSRSASSSGVLVPRPGQSSETIQRGWDWRSGLSEETKGSDILRILRLGLARGLSFGALGSVVSS
ncbi:hypothetical protein Plec18167_004464 [Paecilomyces lecythidis]|uniref:Nuclear pore complex protein Nup85 n=1 Tax=Paecilomyces lecythidis TaxID=3004212 RepID=A0ABR3XS32_9EURO